MSARVLAVGVCTFRRPGVVATIESVGRQDVPSGHALAILVADNDDAPSARAAVEAFAARSGLDVRHLHAPARNISVARNAILDTAQAMGAVRLAFLDDDEVAEPGWLRALCAAMDATGADAVAGPVLADYRPDAPAWMRAGRPHDTVPETDEEGRPIAGHTCNVLIDLDARPFAGLRFDPVRGRTGGEDTAFFAAALRAGARLALAPDAVVREAVPGDRARLRWLLRRRYRMGQTHGSLLADGASPLAQARLAAVAAAKVGFCAAAAAAGLASERARNCNALRGALHMGTLSAFLRRRQVSIYGADDEPGSTGVGPTQADGTR